MKKMTLKLKIVKIIFLIQKYLNHICNKTKIAKKASENNSKCIKMPGFLISY
jgi:hypothetical protein